MWLNRRGSRRIGKNNVDFDNGGINSSTYCIFLFCWCWRHSQFLFLADSDRTALNSQVKEPHYVDSVNGATEDDEQHNGSIQLTLAYGGVSVFLFVPSFHPLERSVIVAKFDDYCGPTRMHIFAVLLHDLRQTHCSTPTAVRPRTAKNKAIQCAFFFLKIGRLFRSGSPLVGRTPSRRMLRNVCQI